MRDSSATLTDNEGALLALVLRRQPISAYQIGRAFETSPIHTLNTSKGKLYPLLHRLEARGLLNAEEVSSDRRRTQLFECTQKGKTALREWAAAFRPEHALLHDPLRKKLQALDLLPREEQMAWAVTASARLRERLAEVEEFDSESDGPFGTLMRENARLSIKARLAWLQRVIESFAGVR